MTLPLYVCFKFFLKGGVSSWQKALLSGFNESKGYGFITKEDGGDVFAHYSAIEGNGFKTLAKGNKVNFDVVNGDKGPKATKIVKL